MTFDPSNLPDESLEDIAAQTAVVSAAWKFLRSFYDGDFSTAWTVMHPVFRLCLVQWWAHANRDSLEATGYSVEKTAEELAQSSPGEHELWGSFARVILRDMRNAYPLDPAVAGIGSTPRVLALDTELLYVHPEPPANGLWLPGEFSMAYGLVMRLTEGQWAVLNWGSEAVPTPGYPPALS